MKSATSVAVLLILTYASTADQPEPKQQLKKVRAMQIDFDPLAKADVPNYKLVVIITTEAGQQHKETYDTRGTPGAIQMTKTVHDSLDAGWDARLDASEKKLI